MKGLYLRKGTYWFRSSRANGKKRRQVSLQTKDYLTAVTRATELIRRWDEEHLLQGGPWRDDVSLYLQEKKRQGRHSRKTSYEAEKRLELLGQQLNFPRVSSVTPAMVDQLVVDLRSRGKIARTKEGGLKKEGLSDASVAAYMRILKAFLSWCVDRGTLAFHPMAGRNYTTTKKTRRSEFFTEEERDRVLERCDQDDLRAILLLGFFAGLRWREMLALKWDWFWFSQGKAGINIHETDYFGPKGKESREIPLSPLLTEFFSGLKEKRCKARGEAKVMGEWVIRPEASVWKPAPGYRFDCRVAMRGLFKQAGLEWSGFHKLRHSFATHLLLKGVGLSDVASLLGNELMVAQKHYGGFLPGSHSAVALLDPE